MVRGWIISAMEKEIKGSIKYAVIIARDISLDLVEALAKKTHHTHHEHMNLEERLQPFIGMISKFLLIT